jgi:hypothetical protein
MKNFTEGNEGNEGLPMAISEESKAHSMLLLPWQDSVRKSDAPIFPKSDGPYQGPHQCGD